MHTLEVCDKLFLNFLNKTHTLRTFVVTYAYTLFVNKDTKDYFGKYLNFFVVSIEKYIFEIYTARQYIRLRKDRVRKLKDGEDDTEPVGRSSPRDILGEVEARELCSKRFHQTIGIGSLCHHFSFLLLLLLLLFPTEIRTDCD